jgi:hypothetical protein
MNVAWKKSSFNVPRARLIGREAGDLAALGELVAEPEAQELEGQNVTYGSIDHSRPRSSSST